VCSLNSGETVVVGGLQEDRSDHDSSGVPYAQDVPLIGSLFSGKDHTSHKTELVVFIRATIIHADDQEGYEERSGVDLADKAAYEQFAKDPRPLFVP
jgi:general secretion pathway protein D